jgi:hypothetical protein
MTDKGDDENVVKLNADRGKNKRKRKKDADAKTRDDDLDDFMRDLSAANDMNIEAVAAQVADCAGDNLDQIAADLKKEGFSDMDIEPIFERAAEIARSQAEAKTVEAKELRNLKTKRQMDQRGIRVIE